MQKTTKESVASGPDRLLLALWNPVLSHRFQYPVPNECTTNAKVSDGSQSPMTFGLSLSESAGSRSLHRLVQSRWSSMTTERLTETHLRLLPDPLDIPK
jgi:hypothetical protein